MQIDWNVFWAYSALRRVLVNLQRYGANISKQIWSGFLASIWLESDLLWLNGLSIHLAGRWQDRLSILHATPDWRKDSIEQGRIFLVILLSSHFHPRLALILYCEIFSNLTLRSASEGTLEASRGEQHQLPPLQRWSEGKKLKNDTKGWKHLRGGGCYPDKIMI